MSKVEVSDRAVEAALHTWNVESDSDDQETAMREALEAALAIEREDWASELLGEDGTGANVELLRMTADGARSVADGHEEVLREARNIDAAADELESLRDALDAIKGGQSGC